MGQSASSPSASDKEEPSNVTLPEEKGDREALIEYMSSRLIGAPEGAAGELVAYYEGLEKILTPEAAGPELEKQRWQMRADIEERVRKQQASVGLEEADPEHEEKHCVHETFPVVAEDASNLLLVSRNALVHGGFGKVFPMLVGECLAAGKLAHSPEDFAGLFDEGLTHALLTSPLVDEALETVVEREMVEPWDGQPIVPLTAIVNAGERAGPLLVMPRIDMSLRQALASDRDDSFTPTDLVDVTLQVMEQLHVLHAAIGFMHRDLHFENIGLTRRREPHTFAHRIRGANYPPGAVLLSRWRVQLLDLAHACAELKNCSDCAFPLKVNAGIAPRRKNRAAPYCSNPAFDVVMLLTSIAKAVPARMLDDPLIKLLVGTYFKGAAASMFGAGVRDLHLLFEPGFLERKTPQRILWTPMATHRMICSVARLVQGGPETQKALDDMIADASAWFQRNVSALQKYNALLSVERKVLRALQESPDDVWQRLGQAKTAQAQLPQARERLIVERRSKVPAKAAYEEAFAGDQQFWQRAMGNLLSAKTSMLLIRDFEKEDARRQRYEAERKAVMEKLFKYDVAQQKKESAAKEVAAAV